MGKAIAIATPVFFLLIALEWLVARRARHGGIYRLNDAVNSLSLGVMSQVVNLFVRVLTIGIYAWVFEHVALGQLAARAVVGVGCSRSCSTTSATTGTTGSATRARCSGRRTSCTTRARTTTCPRRCARPAAARCSAGSSTCRWRSRACRPEMFAVAAVVDLLYQYWIHTELVGKLGWFDRWFASPSNHRVHHAVNDRYIDRNYGGIFMAWDRLFGTFVEESEPCVYGTRAPLDSWDPLWANLEVYADLARKSWACERWARQAARLVHAARLAARNGHRRGVAPNRTSTSRRSGSTTHR